MRGVYPHRFVLPSFLEGLDNAYACIQGGLENALHGEKGFIRSFVILFIRHGVGRVK